MPNVVRLTLAGLAAAVLLPTVGACGNLDEASAASITRDDLVSEMAGQLGQADNLSYAATYQLAGGDTATITQGQRPTRVAYAYPGGRLIITADATIRCKGSETAPACAETTPQPSTDTNDTGAMVSPDVVLAMLNAAALDTAATVTEHDTTIAGHHATCLDISGVSGTLASTFATCVTSEGVLGSFTATINGTAADVALTAYSDKVQESAFTLPSAAKVTDKRK